MAGEVWVGFQKSGERATEVLVLVVHVGDHAQDLDVEVLNLLMGSAYSEVLIEGKTSCRSSPDARPDVLPGITKEVEVGEERVLDDAVPVKLAAGRGECGSGDVVAAECSSYGLGAGLESLGDVLPQLVAYMSTVLLGL